jgi:hypothetical protein
MRTQALILLIPFLVFLMETASFIPGMEEACAIVVPEKVSCSKPEEPSSCGAKKAMSCCSKPQKEEERQDKEEDNPCDSSPDCTSCPVCYNFIFQAQYEWQPKGFVFKKGYSSLTTDYIFAYTSSVWKPPNGRSIPVITHIQ